MQDEKTGASSALRLTLLSAANAEHGMKIARSEQSQGFGKKICADSKAVEVNRWIWRN
jgi:hypothetical protein